VIVMGMNKPSGPGYRRASERTNNAASMLLFLGTRVRRVVGDMVTESRQAYKPPHPLLGCHRVILHNSLGLLTSAVLTFVIPRPEELPQLAQARRADTHFLSFPADREPRFTDHRLNHQNSQGRLTTSEALGFHTTPYEPLPASSG
jgi:hypothetical protein